MKRTRKTLVRYIVLLTFTILSGLTSLYLYGHFKVNEIYAVDPLVITYNGSAPPDPVFTVNNMLPGDEVEKVFNVKNDSSEAENVTMRAIKDTETQEFADILEVIIADVSGPDIFGGTLGIRSLEDFFAQGDISLGNFPAGSDKSYRVKVKFPASGGNEYQNAIAIFDIIWRTDLPEIELPPECRKLEGKITNIVEGTEGNDKIHGSAGSDLILAKGGNDKVDSSSNDDCVVLGDGNDQVNSESGNDIILGGRGNDKIDSGSGSDKVYGGLGNDDIELGAGKDKGYGNEGNDDIDGGSDDDEIHGGSGNDTLRGDSGDDKIFGDEGNDDLHGGSGNDLLDGGADTDTLHGNAGADTCINGESENSCEI